MCWLQSAEQVRALASGPWLAFWSTRISSAGFRRAEDHVRQRAMQSGSLAWALADAMHAPDGSDIARSTLYSIAEKLQNCTASRAELLALGPLRYHVTRMELVGVS